MWQNEANEANEAVRVGLAMMLKLLHTLSTSIQPYICTQLIGSRHVFCRFRVHLSKFPYFT